MTATKKIVEAESILTKMQNKPDEFQVILNDFVRTINDVFNHLLEEYQLKFDCTVGRVGLEKFKVKAKKSGNIRAINFLIWYEKEYRRIKNDPTFVHMLERDGGYRQNTDQDDTINACSALLNEAKMMAYYAYENF